VVAVSFIKVNLHHHIHPLGRINLRWLSYKFQ